MEGKKNIVTRNSTKFLVLIFTVGIAGHINYGTRGLMLSLTPFTLFITMGVVFYALLCESNRRLILWFIITYLLTFLIEVIGVKTGVVFGEYLYGSTLGFKILSVPVIIGLNWVFVILGAIIFSQKVTSDRNLASLISAIIAVVFDFVLEPVATKLDYWTWQNGIIPFQNYLAWFVISFFVARLFHFMNLHVKTDLPKIFLIIQTVFFASLFLFI